MKKQENPLTVQITNSEVLKIPQEQFDEIEKDDFDTLNITVPYMRRKWISKEEAKKIFLPEPTQQYGDEGHLPEPPK